MTSCTSITFKIPEIILPLPEKETQDKINSIMQLVYTTSIGIEKGDKVALYEFTKTCQSEFGVLQQLWKDVYSIANSNGKLTDFEYESYGFHALGFFIALLGNTSQMRIYAEYLGRFMMLGSSISGGNAAITTIPVVITLEIIYSIGIVALIQKNFKQLGIILNHHMYIPRNEAVSSLGRHLNIFIDAFAGNRTEGSKHIESYLGQLKWFSILITAIEADIKLTDLCSKVSLLLALYNFQHKSSYVTLFGDFGPKHLAALLSLVKSNTDTQDDLDEMLSLSDGVHFTDIAKAFIIKLTDKRIGSSSWLGLFGENNNDE